MPVFRYVNSETGESVDDHGNEYLPPPRLETHPIIPGVYPPNHRPTQTTGESTPGKIVRRGSRST